MSTTILYLAIVAIWAGFLVPGWIRRPHGAESDVDDVEAESGDVVVDAELTDTESDVDVGYADYPAAADSDAAPLQSRQQMLRARRRVLATLLVLTLGSAAGVTGGLLPLWTAVPPAALLTFYVLLLREVAKAEAEAADRWANEAAQAVQVQAERAAAPAPRGAEPIAEVIDIASRAGDQLYDQYADAAARAVGD